MKVYYNEIDLHAARVLQALMDAGQIPAGDIDTRSIADVAVDDVAGYDQCHFFAGIGVWAYAITKSRFAGGRLWTGSPPCQPFSAAGQGRGVADARHLWPEFWRLIQGARPVRVIGEQTASAAGRAWLDSVFADLEAGAYAYGAADLAAGGYGAPHVRQRLFFFAWDVANSDGVEREGRAIADAGHVYDGSHARRAQSYGCVALGGEVCDLFAGGTGGFWAGSDWLWCVDGRWRAARPGSLPLAYGTANRMAALRAIGNAVVAPVAVEFLESVYDVTNGGFGDE